MNGGTRDLEVLELLRKRFNDGSAGWKQAAMVLERGEVDERTVVFVAGHLIADELFCLRRGGLDDSAKVAEGLANIGGQAREVGVDVGCGAHHPAGGFPLHESFPQIAYQNRGPETQWSRLLRDGGDEVQISVLAIDSADNFAQEDGQLIDAIRQHDAVFFQVFFGALGHEPVVIFG